MPLAEGKKNKGGEEILLYFGSSLQVFSNAYMASRGGKSCTCYCLCSAYSHVGGAGRCSAESARQRSVLRNESVTVMWDVEESR